MCKESECTFMANGESIHIRPASVADAPEVMALDEELTGIAKPRYWADFFQRHAAYSGIHFMVAEAGGRMLGFIIGEIRAWEFGSPPCGWVFAVSVRPEARLAKVGTRLLEAISTCFRNSGVTRMRTMVARDDQVVMSFFRSQGLMAGPSIQLEKDLD